MYYLCNYDISPKLGHSVAKSTRNENQIYIQIDNFLYRISYTVMKHSCEAGNYKNSEFSISLWLAAVSDFENRHKK